MIFFMLSCLISLFFASVRGLMIFLTDRSVNNNINGELLQGLQSIFSFKAYLHDVVKPRRRFISSSSRTQLRPPSFHSGSRLSGKLLRSLPPGFGNTAPATSPRRALACPDR